MHSNEYISYDDLSNKANNVIYLYTKNQAKDYHLEAREPLVEDKKTNLKQWVESTEACLGMGFIQKMLHRFLSEKQMPREQLAETLEITAKELEQLLTKKANSELINKIELPLIKLYCATKFEE